MSTRAFSNAPCNALKTSPWSSKVGRKPAAPRVTLGEMESARLDSTTSVVELLKERSERSESLFETPFNGSPMIVSPRGSSPCAAEI